VNCNCISTVEAKVAAKYTADLGATAEAKIGNVGFGVTDDGGVSMNMFAPIKVTADVPRFRTGKKIDLFFSFCPFCGKSKKAGEEAHSTGVQVSAYSLGVPANSLSEVFVERCAQRDGSYLWRVTKRGDCLNKDGEWEYEPLPSSRDDAFLERCRFDSAETAITAARAAIAKATGEKV
jgi:hypothetical protein